MKNALLFIFLGTMLPASGALAAGPDLSSLLKNFDGKKVFLKFDVVRMQHMVGGLDATYVYPDGTVRYEGGGGMRKAQSASADQWTREVERTLPEGSTIRSINKGTAVTVLALKGKDKEVEVELQDSGKTKHKIRMRFPDESYGVEDVEKMLSICFAASEAEAAGQKATVAISLGMTIDEVIKAKGAPKTRADLGQKTILTYEDMKLIFMDGKLSDVQ